MRASDMQDVEGVKLRPGTTRRVLIQRGAQVGALAVSGVGLSGLLSACGDDDSPSAGAVSADDVEGATGEIRVLGYQFYEDDDLQDTGAVTAKWGYVGTDNELVVKVKPENSFDVVDGASSVMVQLKQIDRLQPIDVDLLTNYEGINPTLRDDPLWQDEEGQILAVPYALASNVLSYNSAEVPAATTVSDLLQPQYKGGVGLGDTFTNLPAINLGLGLAEDPSKPAIISEEALEEIMSFLDDLKPQLRTIFQFGEEVNLFPRGDITITMNSPATFVPAASVGGAKIEGVLSNEAGSLTFVDTWAIAADADAPAALQWIDGFISKPVQKGLVENADVTPAVDDVVPLDQLAEPVRVPLDELLRRAPILGSAETESADGIVGLDEQVEVWNDYKASI